jgi:hypothetical protein
MLAGPDTTAYEMLPLEGEAAEMENGAPPKVWLAMGAKARSGIAGLTIKLLVADCAALSVSAACIARRITVPAPMRVTIFPEMVAGPDATAYVTTPLEVDDAEIGNGESP